MRTFCKIVILILFGSLLLVSGCCLFAPSEPDVIVWRSAFIPDEWEGNVLSRVGQGPGSKLIRVAEARQINDCGNGRMYSGNEMFAVVAAYNKKSGRFVARWGYSPNPRSGENGLEVTITDLTTYVVGPSLAKHPVEFQLMPDFSSLTMSWGPRLEKHGTLIHTVKWKAIQTD